MGMQLKVKKRNQVEQLKLDQLEAINRFTQEIKKNITTDQNHASINRPNQLTSKQIIF